MRWGVELRRAFIFDCTQRSCLRRSPRVPDMTTTNTISPPQPTQTSALQSRWLLVFILGYLALIADGADVMMYGLTLTRIKDEFGLTNVESGALGSLTLIGMAIGGIAGGWASDRLGRVRVVAWALALFSLGAGMLGFTHNFFEFAVVRFISSLGIGCMVLVTTLVAEYVPTARRSLILGVLQTGISAGYIVVIALSNWILPHYGWRTLYYLSALPVRWRWSSSLRFPSRQAGRRAWRCRATGCVDLPALATFRYSVNGNRARCSFYGPWHPFSFFRGFMV
jgi:AAHS family cis,cis-muconate transporter-like MFS transporter